MFSEIFILFVHIEKNCNLLYNYRGDKIAKTFRRKYNEKSYKIQYTADTLFPVVADTFACGFGYGEPYCRR